AYDRANNVLVETKLHDPGNSEVFTYNSAYEVNTFSRGTLNAAGTAVAVPTTTPGVLQSQSWNLDGEGNWVSNTLTTGGVASTENRSHSNVNEVALVSGMPYGDRVDSALEYDDNGNLIDDGVRTYEWDALDRLRKVIRKADGQEVASYTYDSSD